VARILTLAAAFFRTCVAEGPRSALRKTVRKLAQRLSWLAGTDAAIAALQTELAQTRELAGQLQARLDQSGRDQQHLANLIGELQLRMAVRDPALSGLANSVRSLAHLHAHAAPVARSTLKVSVVMPVYERVARAAEAVRSVLAQEGVSFELIVVDDGSTEDLRAALGPDVSHPALRLLRVSSGGQGRARNQGLAVATGDVVAYLDADNWMLPGYLAQLAAAYESAPSAQCAHAALLWDDGAQGVHLRHDRFDWDAVLACEVNLDTNAFSHRRSLTQQLGGWGESWPRHADLEFVLRLTQHHPPLRVHAIAAHYDHRHDERRISMSRPSLPSLLAIRRMYAKPAADPLRILVYCYDYPQLSESYVDAEIAWLLRQGFHVEVFSRHRPGSPGVPIVPVHLDDLAGVVDRMRPDILHCHWLELPEEIQALASEARIPLTIRGHGFEFDPGAAERFGTFDFVRAIFVYPHFVDRIGGDRSRIRPLRVAFDSTRKQPGAKDRRLVLRTAACLETKDIDTFFHVAASRPEYRFVLVLSTVTERPAQPGYFQALNESLGNPVEIHFDLQHAQVDELMRAAGVYLHTFGFVQPFGMPISIAEALACGAIVLARDHPDVRAYAGPHARYYRDAEGASALLGDMLDWDDDAWALRGVAGTDFAYSRYADDVVLPGLVDEWRHILAAAPQGDFA
jgi:glycosyltransferase involved in cell wall biosynthesis